MPGLLDIGPLTREHTINGKKLQIFPLSIDHIFVLIKRYESFNSLMKKHEIAKERMAALAMDMLAPDAMAYIMVASTGGAELTKNERQALGSKFADDYQEKFNKAAEEKWSLAQAKAKMLGAGDVLAIFDMMYELTFTEGIGPFVVRFMKAQNNVLEAKTSLENSVATSQGESYSALDTDADLPRYGNHLRARSTRGSPSESPSKRLN